MQYKSNNFDFSKGSVYASKDEREAAAKMAAIEAAQLEDAELDRENSTVRWTTKSGHEVAVTVWSRTSFEMSIDSFSSTQHTAFSPVPASQVAFAKANGIVAMLGKVGITAEQKKLIEAKF